MNSHKAWFALGTILLVATQGCNGGPTKNLTTSSARDMLKTKLGTSSQHTYRFAINSVSEVIQLPTREDYSVGSYRNDDPRSSVQRLLQAGYIIQSREDSSVPNVSGDYKVELTWPKENGIWTRNAIYTFNLSMQPTYATVSGGYTANSWYVTGQEAMRQNGPLTGSVSPDGTVKLGYGSQFGTTEENYKFSSNGSTLTLTGKQPFLTGNPNMTLVGTGPGGSIVVPKFSYAFSDKFKRLPSVSANVLDAGDVEIDDVSNLLLATDTIAHAQFTWHVNFNDAAKALTGQASMQGTGEMNFGKQPDGAWVLTAYNLR